MPVAPMYDRHVLGPALLVHVVELDAVEVHELAVEGDGLVARAGPAPTVDDLAHRPQRLVARRRRPCAASGSHHAPMPEDHPAGREVVEGGERRGEERGVAHPHADHARAELDALGRGAERGQRHGRLAHQPALGLPHRLEAGGLGGLRVAHAVADRVRVLQVERDRVLIGQSSSSRANRRAACSRGPGPDLGRRRPGSGPLVEHDLAVDLDLHRAHAGRVGEVPRLHRRVRPGHDVVERLRARARRRSRATPTTVSGDVVDVVGAGEREREAELLEHVGADAVGAERTGLAKRAGPGVADRVVEVRARVVHDGAGQRVGRGARRGPAASRRRPRPARRAPAAASTASSATCTCTPTPRSAARPHTASSVSSESVKHGVGADAARGRRRAGSARSRPARPWRRRRRCGR